MGRVRWVMVAGALVIGLWMGFDGMRALIVGDYLTPRSGPYAGQLGSWAWLVRAAGIEPRSVVMKSVFVVYAALWFGAAAGIALRVPRLEAWVLALAVVTLWYVPVGSALALLEVVLAIVVIRTTPER